MNALKEVVNYKGSGRIFDIVVYMPPWKDCDGNCIAPSDPMYRNKFTLRGINCTNEEAVEWLMAVAGPKIVWIEENKFEYAEFLPARTIGEWIEWEVGKAQWEHQSPKWNVTLYFHEVFEARLKSRMQSIDERFNAHLSTIVNAAYREIDELCAKALQRIEQFL